VKTIKDFTQKIQDKIPSYIERATKGVFDGGRYNTFSREKAVKAVNWNYEFCGFKKPMILVAENPLEAQLLFNFVKQFIKKDNQLDSQLHSQLYSQLYSQLDKQLGNQLDKQLGNQLDSQLYNQLGNQLRNQLGNQLNSQLRNQLYNQLYNQLGNQLNSQLRNQLDSQLYSQLDKQLGNQLDSQLYNQLRNQLGNQLGNQLRNQLRNQLGNQLDKYNDDYLFTLNVYSDAYYSWFEFMRREFKLALSINDDFQKCFTLQRESGIYSAIFSEALCVISKYPKKVHRNESGELHNTKDCAVEWGSFSPQTVFDGQYVNGRSIEKKWFDKANSSLSLEEFNSINNEDIRAGIVSIIKENKGDQGLMEFLGAIEIDQSLVNHKNGYKETLRLYKTKYRFIEACDRNGNTNKPYAWINMTCPSTGQSYLISTCPEFNNAVECAKWHRPEVVPSTLPYFWQSAN
jgi:DNA-binding FadR family transcriptional regulator